MGETKIEWAHFTFNPWIGCQKVSPGCDHCYAERDNARWKWNGDGTWGPHAPRKRTSEANWRKPLQWAKAARGAGSRPRVFCASLADVWDNQVPIEWRRDLFHLIWETPELDWLLLTKRPENILKMIPAAIGETELWPFPNVWLGTTCEDQEHYDRRWPILRSIPAHVRFISHEPSLGPLLPSWQPDADPSWIICGGESGPHARMMDPEWARATLARCKSLDIPFFMKQMTGKAPIPPDLMVRQFPRL